MPDSADNTFNQDLHDAMKRSIDQIYHGLGISPEPVTRQAIPYIRPPGITLCPECGLGLDRHGLHIDPHAPKLVTQTGNNPPATLQDPPEMCAYCPECDTTTKYQETPPRRCPTCLTLLTSTNSQPDDTDETSNTNGKPGKPTKPVFDHDAGDVSGLMTRRALEQGRQFGVGGSSREAMRMAEWEADPTNRLLGEDPDRPVYGIGDVPGRDRVAELLDVPEPPRNRITSGPTKVFVKHLDGTETLLGTVDAGSVVPEAGQTVPLNALELKFSMEPLIRSFTVELDIRQDDAARILDGLDLKKEADDG